MRDNASSVLGAALMFEFVVAKIIIPFLNWMFWIGVVGCIVVIPWCAFKMFSVLFEKDQVDSLHQ